MRKLILLALCVGIAASAQAAYLDEDWETGTDGWADVGAGPFPALDNTQNTTPGGTWSLKTADTAVNYTNAKDFVIEGMTETNWTAEWTFQHKTGTTREYVQLQSYSGGGGSGTLLQLISFGVYNAAPANTTLYNFRVTNGGVGWSNTNIARVANTWHTMKVEQFSDGTLNFYVDGVLGATTTTTSIYPITKVRVGSALGNNTNGAWFDDILVTPEPAAAVLLGLGGLLFGRRRRTA